MDGRELVDEGFLIGGARRLFKSSFASIRCLLVKVLHEMRWWCVLNNNNF